MTPSSLSMATAYEGHVTLTSFTHNHSSPPAQTGVSFSVRDVLDALQRQRSATLRVTILRNNGSAGSRLDDSSASLELELDSTSASADASQVTRDAPVFPSFPTRNTTSYK
jgi:hypothetical protein